MALKPFPSYKALLETARSLLDYIRYELNITVSLDLGQKDTKQMFEREQERKTQKLTNSLYIYELRQHSKLTVSAIFDFISSFSALLNFKTGLITEKLTENVKKIAKFAKNSIY